MKHSSWMITGAFAAIAVLLVAGLALVVIAPGALANDQTPQVSINDQAAPTSIGSTPLNDGSAMHNFTITVGANVEGKKVPIEGALVLVYSVNVAKVDNTTTIVLEKVAEQRTDANGQVEFQLAQGRYIVIAHYHGLNGFGRVNLTEDLGRNVMLHHWGGEFLNRLETSKKISISFEN